MPPETGLLAVVKANAYGHGAVAVGRVALAAGAMGLAVATVGEGQALRRAGIESHILVLGPIDATEVDTALQQRLTVTVATSELLAAIQREVHRSLPGAPVDLHVKVDTGMRRYGAMPDLSLALCRRIAVDPRLRLEGVFTHFATADEDDGNEGFAALQAALLQPVLEQLTAENLTPKWWHQANSAATLRGNTGRSSFVRMGLALYGITPAPSLALPDGVRPVMTLRSRVARVFELAPGDTVGYGRTYQSGGAERAALVPIGYADGYRRALSNRGWMGLMGGRADVIGRVSMDQTVVRIPAGVRVEVGDELTVMGGALEEGAPNATQLSDLCDTIPYEILTGIAGRVPRDYWQNGQRIVEPDERG